MQEMSINITSSIPKCANRADHTNKAISANKTIHTNNTISSNSANSADNAIRAKSTFRETNVNSAKRANTKSHFTKYATHTVKRTYVL